MTHNVLVVGDSLTWGADPSTKRRHPPEQRWPNVLSTCLGGGAQVITEALCGRTTSMDDNAVIEERNAARSLPMLLASHQPLDLVAIMLGTNDLKPHLGGHAFAAQAGMRRLVQLVQRHPYLYGSPPQVVIMAPPPRIATPNRPDMSAFTIAQSRLLVSLYRELATELGVGFFDAGAVCVPSEADGVHLDAVQTAQIGRAIAPLIQDRLSQVV